MSEYDESFEQVSSGSNPKNRSGDANALHKLKLSIDLLSVRNMNMAANVFLTYQLHLQDV